MTDNDIIKSLECCTSGITDNCKYCPFKIRCCDADESLDPVVLDLINRQKAEIERLRKEKYPYIWDVIKDARAEAIKEFAERLKKESLETDVSYMYGRECWTDVVTVLTIDEVLKEMVGES